MLLSQLIKNLNYKSLSGTDVNIKSLGHDSRQITEDMLYFCLSGTQVDGHKYAEEAVAKGAAAIVVERVLPLKVPQLLVENSRAAMSEIASAFYGCPTKKLKLIGVTGTNGKTTTTYIIKAIAQKAGIKVGVIGTSGILIGAKFLPPLLTTPDPIDCHRIFSQMAEDGIEWVVMEVSAHALELDKLAGVVFDVAAFTNLSQDHLDYFENMQAYKNAKKKLFSPAMAFAAAINVDDEAGREILSECRVPSYSYGAENPADVFSIDYESSSDGLKYVINCFDDISEISFKLPGRFNMMNTLCAATVCSIMGITTDIIREGIESVQSVDGRFNIIMLPNGAKAVVDYAHTPVAIKNALCGVREWAKGRIITVFGCGGNRDKTKRASMGWLASKYSSHTIITSDNPRFEEPLSIIADIEQGFKAANCNKYVIIEKRKEAIRYALRIAEEGDVVLIAGKGNENYQEVMGEKHSFSDCQEIEAFIRGSQVI